MGDPVSETLAWGQTLTWPQVHGGPRRIRLVAAEADRAAVARSLDLDGLTSLTAEATIAPWLDGVEIAGEVSAVAQRTCGLTLEPFEEPIAEALHIRIVPSGSPNVAPVESGEITIDLDAEDPPDEAVDGLIDPTRYVVEALALALDPFPRKPGAVFSAPETTGPVSPFAVLAQLTPPRKPG